MREVQASSGDAEIPSEQGEEVTEFQGWMVIALLVLILFAVARGIDKTAKKG